jgi:hypothetical protein
VTTTFPTKADLEDEVLYQKERRAELEAELRKALRIIQRNGRECGWTPSGLRFYAKHIKIAEATA